MNPIDSLNIGDLLKTQFVGPINSSVEKEVMLLKQLAWTNKHRMGNSRDIVHPINLVRNTSLGFRYGSTDGAGNAEHIPETAPSETKQAQTKIRSLYAYVEFYGEALWLTQNDLGAFADAFKNDIGSLIDSMKIEINRAAYGDGTGELGEVVEATPSNQITIRTSATIAASPNMNWFEKGQLLDIYSPTNFAAGTATQRNASTTPIRVLTKSKGTTQVTLTVQQWNAGTGAWDAGTLNASFGVVAGDKVVVKGNYMREPYGLKAIIDDGSYTSDFLGIDESVYDRWNSYVQNNSGTLEAFSEMKLQNIIDELEIFDPTSENILLITRKDIRNKIARTIKTNILQPSTTNLKGGFKTVDYGGIRLYTDIFAPYSKIWGVNLKNIIPHQLNPSKDNVFGAFSFQDLDGKVLHAARKSDVYWAKGLMNYNFTCNQRNSHAVYEDIDPAL